ncbi:alpha-amylase [Candidatus Poribacteria bacterium]|nr:alpha-amylase [Candidatus Poribacteria bacterium]
MAYITFYFQIHQPRRLNEVDLVGFPGHYHKDLEKAYFNEGLNSLVFNRASEKCYFPATEIILSSVERLKKTSNPFKVAFGISGTFLDQCATFQPKLLDLFKKLADTGCAEFLGETYYHSLAGLYEKKDEFKAQVEMHKDKIKKLFGFTPVTFRNTELLYNNTIAKNAQEMGFNAVLTEGLPHVLQWRSPDYVYKAKNSNVKLLMRNYGVSDEVGYRFSHKIITADDFAYWLSSITGETCNVFMDYETFGEHQWLETGIMEFLRHLPDAIMKYESLKFATPGEVAASIPPNDEIDVYEYSTISWADLERDSSAWLGNDTQKAAFGALKNLEKQVKATKDEKFIKIWRNLQTSDHLYFMCNKWLGDGDVHGYFSHYGSIWKAIGNFFTILTDFQQAIAYKLIENKDIKTT